MVPSTAFGRPRAYQIPLVARFRGTTARHGWVWRGRAGWGEFSPFDDYRPADCIPWLLAAREAADFGFPPPLRQQIPVNVTVPAVTPEMAASLVESSGGCRTAKVKVGERGHTLAQERARLAAVREVLGPGGRIRVDANGAWDVDTAVRNLAALNRAAGGLEYAEQPCRTTAELAAVRRRSSVPVAADESIRRAADPFEVKRLEAADVVVLKVQPLGGVRACLDLALRLELPVVVSSAVETSVGLAMGVALAAALPKLEFACGLATGQLLVGDVVRDPLRVVDGCIEV
ncbi:MAG: o-succinylbenzoate synthase, partial [Bifidobacteriaceae bacterium]|nr:o-succinylbenzoate synthase [Bifidobacteriaceae bacterium]